MKNTSLIITALLLMLSMNAAAEKEKVTMYFFWGQGCSHCTDMKPFIQELDDEYPNLKIIKMEVFRSPENWAFLQNMSQAYNATVRGVPAVFIGSEIVRGYSGDRTEKLIISMIVNCSKDGCESPDEILEEYKSRPKTTTTTSTTTTTTTTTIPPSSCFDTDGGLNINVSGYVTGKDSLGAYYIYYDNCTGDTSLGEWTCTMYGTPDYSNLICEGRCSMGECVSNTTTTTVTTTTTSTRAERLTIKTKNTDKTITQLAIVTTVAALSAIIYGLAAAAKKKRKRKPDMGTK